MNLYDIVRRKDRSLAVISGTVEALRSDSQPSYLGIRLAPQTHIRLDNANEFVCLQTFPRDIAWKIAGKRLSGNLQISLHGSSGRQQLLAGSGGTSGDEILLTWPAWAGEEQSFSISIVNGDSRSLEIASSPVFDTRAALRPLLRGRGVEVGPGANPQVRPSNHTEVQYVEVMPPEQWIANYAKDRTPAEEDKALWSRYLIGDAHRIECCADGSLDFIFSNHVFEHLMNPLGVLENWSRKLKSSGVIACVVPDLRYCFDLRQQPSTEADWDHEYETNSWSIPLAKYEKWCCYTQPNVTPKNLIERQYSIHIHYYTPQTFRGLLQRACALKFGSHFFLNTSPNNKDFGFILWKTQRS